MKELKISPDLSLPQDAVTQTFAILAKKRRGKTYTASVMAEEMIKTELPFAVLDPTSAWWGLRASADGKKAGYPVIIIGGDHGDIPLEPTAGHVIADLVVEHPGYYVIDIGMFNSNAEQDRFATDFGERLYRAKAKRRFPMHLFVDEADAFIPQQPMPDQRRMLGAYDTLVRRGGLRGIGITVISQRPAVINKNVLSQVECLAVLQIVGTNDREAIEKWVKTHGGKKNCEALMESLSSLDLGEAWFWSPAWLDIFKKVRIRKRETFNSSKTPEVGDETIQPKVLAKVDLEAIRDKVAATIEKAKADDPKELHKRIKELEAQKGADPQAIDRARREGKVSGYKEALAEVSKKAKAVHAAIANLQATADDLERAAAYDDGAKFPMANQESVKFRKLADQIKTKDAPHSTKITIKPGPWEAPQISNDLPPAAAKMLAALERNYPNTYPWDQVCVLAGIIPGNGYFYGGKKALLASGLVYEQEGRIGAENGKNVNHTSQDEIVRMWAGKLKQPAPDMLRVLFEYKETSVEVLAHEIGKKPGNGYWYGGLSQLRDAGLIVQDKDMLRVTELLA